MTEEERMLWYMFLRRYKVRFYRQRLIGSYIVDFYCSSAHLVIELDGSQHYEPEGMIKDRIRTSRLEEHDLLVLHIPNNEVKSHFREVCEYIDNLVNERMRLYRGAE